METPIMTSRPYRPQVSQAKMVFHIQKCKCPIPLTEVVLKAMPVQNAFTADLYWIYFDYWVKYSLNGQPRTTKSPLAKVNKFPHFLLDKYLLVNVIKIAR